MEPTNITSLRELEAAVAPLRLKLVEHPLYARIATRAQLHEFLEHHVFAVWDFMSLLKSLQTRLTCVAVPWVPSSDAAARRLINEIVLEEESDLLFEGQSLSHYEMYLMAMEQCGANTAPIKKLVERISRGASVYEALDDENVPPAARDFVRATFHVIDRGAPHALAAAFAIGREDLIPDMFRQLVADFAGRFPGELTLLHEYLERHIELDENRHTPLARRMVERLCGNDAARWREATEAAAHCLQARLDLWNKVVGRFHLP